MISTTAAPSPISAKTTVPPDVLATRELVKIYGGRAVVNGINVNVKAGEIVGLLGPNGAGKTTTFYMIVGLVRPNSGSVIFRDQDVTTFPMFKRARLGMGYLPQEESIFRKMTVEQNILAIFETLSIVDRAYLIYEGRVESEGSKDFLINDPISRQLYLGERFRM